MIKTKVKQFLIILALGIGLATIALAFWPMYHLEETFGRDLDYIEE